MIDTDILQRQIPSFINKRVGQAMHQHQMLSQGDKVLLGVSGGVDSTILAWLLKVWLKKAPIQYTLVAVYIDNGYWRPDCGGEHPARRIAEVMTAFDIEMKVVKGRSLEKEDCFLCARNRRSQLFDLAAEMNMNKIALGHHKDDLIETLIINMLYSGNISTMMPNQALFDGELKLIRPLAYLEKNAIRQLAGMLGIEAIPNYCPIERNTRREKVRTYLEMIYAEEPNTRNSLFRSLFNVREGYMM